MLVLLLLLQELIFYFKKKNMYSMGQTKFNHNPELPSILFIQPNSVLFLKSGLFLILSFLKRMVRSHNILRTGDCRNVVVIDTVQRKVSVTLLPRFSIPTCINSTGYGFEDTRSAEQQDITSQPTHHILKRFILSSYIDRIFQYTAKFPQIHLNFLNYSKSLGIAHSWV